MQSTGSQPLSAHDCVSLSGDELHDDMKGTFWRERVRNGLPQTHDDQVDHSVNWHVHEPRLQAMYSVSAPQLCERRQRHQHTDTERE